MSDFQFQEMFPHGEDTTPYRRLDGDFVAVDTFRGKPILSIDDAALVKLAAAAVRDVSHLFRPGHLAQLRKILDDPEASSNDRFVALNMLKNANIAAGMILPSCQDTGTAIVLGKKGQQLWTGGDDERAISRRPICATRSSRR
jgi:fumarate hydratase class I